MSRIVESLRCILQTKNHRRCKNRILRSKKCWIHLQKDENLRIKKSTIPKANFGLFPGMNHSTKIKILHNTMATFHIFQLKVSAFLKLILRGLLTLVNRDISADFQILAELKI